MKYVYACVVGRKASESLCYLLMYLNPTLNKDYLLYVTRSLVLCVYFVDRCLSFCTFSFGHCVVCPLSSNSFYYDLFTRSVILYSCWLFLQDRPFKKISFDYSLTA